MCTCFVVIVHHKASAFANNWDVLLHRSFNSIQCAH